MQKLRLTIFRVAVIADLHSCAESDHSALGLEIRIPYPTYLFSLSSLQSASPFLAVKPQTARFIVEQATVSEGANLPSVLVQPLFSNLQPTRFRKQGYLEAKFDAVDSPAPPPPPQDLISANLLRECSQSRDAKFRALNRFDDGKSIQGRR